MTLGRRGVRYDKTRQQYALGPLKRIKMWARRNMVPIVTIKTQWVIRLAWGPRRVSSKADPGTKAYPESVTAGLTLWMQWIFDAQRMRRNGVVYVVVTPPRVDYYGRIIAQQEKERLNRPDPILSSQEIEKLTHIRIAARRDKDFDTSDYIRDFMSAHGVKTGDHALATKGEDE